MTEQFCKPQDLCMTDAMPFQQRHECRTTLPLADVLTDRFFNNVRANLRAGDSIAICQYEAAPGNHHKAKLVAFCEVRVSEIAADAVKLFVTKAPVVVTGALYGEAGDDTIEGGSVRYVKGSGQVRWNPGSKAYDIVVDGKVVVAGIPRERKEWAQAVARGDEPLPADDTLPAAA